MLSKSITRKDVEDVIRQELVQEAWQEISQTDEVKRNYRAPATGGGEVRVLRIPQVRAMIRQAMGLVPLMILYSAHPKTQRYCHRCC